MVENIVNKINHKIGEAYRSVATNFKEIPSESKFEEEGILTPDEFVAAGDFLVAKCPTWKWAEAEKDKLNKYLPKDKQYLVTTATCNERACSAVQGGEETENEDGWLITEKKEREEAQEIDMDQIGESQAVEVEIKDNHFGMEVVDDSGEAQLDANPEDIMVVDDEDNIMKSRVYTVSVAYDLYYLVPRIFLVGFDEKGAPLSSEAIKEDIMSEYIDKTVTIEDHPHLTTKCVSVHPCRHAQLLKKMGDDFKLGGKKLEAYFSIIIFLKFLSSVVPTINYDFTMDIDFK